MTDQCDFLLPQFPAYSFDENLHEVTQNHQDFESYILKIKELISKSPSDQNKILLYENLGLALRVVRLLDESEFYLQKALSLSTAVSVNRQIQNLLRLAHVYQWQKQFQKAHALFDQARSLLNEFSIGQSLKASYHQHLGKCYFDQEHFNLALIEFETALKLRIEMSAPIDQIQSTELALNKTKQLCTLKIPEGFKIRKASIEDALDIHKAHMISIQEICSKDHTEAEINVWGRRSFEQVNRTPAIQNHFYLVIEFENKIEGFCHASVMHKGHDRFGYLNGFYITPKILKKGIGHIFINLVFEYVKSENISLIKLRSTITSFNFYSKYGFVKTGELSGPVRNGVVIRGYPMERAL